MTCSGFKNRSPGRPFGLPELFLQPGRNRADEERNSHLYPSTLLRREERAMMKPEGPFCQSCGMPLMMDPQGGGTEAGGAKSAEYCSHCYQNGAFTLPDLTAAQMQERVRGKLTEMHLPPPAIDGAVAGIPS